MYIMYVWEYRLNRTESAKHLVTLGCFNSLPRLYMWFMYKESLSQHMHGGFLMYCVYKARGYERDSYHEAPLIHLVCPKREGTE